MAINPFPMGSLFGLNVTPEQQLGLAAEREIGALLGLQPGAPATIEAAQAPNPLNPFSALGAVIQGPAATQALLQQNVQVSQQNAALRQRAEEANQRAKERNQEQIAAIKARVAEIRAQKDARLAEMGFKREESAAQRTARDLSREDTQAFQASEARKDRESNERIAGMRSASGQKLDAAFDEERGPQLLDLMSTIREGVPEDPSMVNPATGAPLPGATLRPLTPSELSQAMTAASAIIRTATISEEKRESLLDILQESATVSETEYKKSEILSRPPPQERKQVSEDTRSAGQRFGQAVLTPFEKFAGLFTPGDAQLIDDMAGSLVDIESGGDAFGQSNVDIFKRAFPR